MGTHRDSAEPDLRQVQIAILAKAPLAGFAKTRLIPVLGARGAARLQREFIRRTLRTATAAQLGPVTLWCAPDAGQRFFRALRRAAGVNCLDQPDGDLGVKMHSAALRHCASGPVLIVGTDCPALTPHDLRAAARALLDGAEVVLGPAEDGGYVLVGLRSPTPSLFGAMPWGTSTVLSDTRSRAGAQGLELVEIRELWDVDEPADLSRVAGALAQGRSP